MLSEIIKVDVKKCVNCHLCIGVCPVKYCNDASDPEKGIQINPNLCIGCGACIKVCSHEARYYIDDTERFIEDLEKGEKIASLVTPAVGVNFPHQLKKLLGWLKVNGVKMNFDVSFGAEITAYQYIKTLKKGGKTPIIAQPCPPVVSYIEIYKPELIKYLAPTGSPETNMAAWVHHNYPGMKLAFISPCIAKKREFEDVNTKGIINYNVTIANLKRHFKSKGININDYDDHEFDGPMEAERGLLFSKPGGLCDTLKRYNLPFSINQIRVTGGREVYDEFFEEIEDEIKRNECDVLIVDVLNCLHGCNRGTGTNYKERTTNDGLKLQVERLEKLKADFYHDEESLIRLEWFLQNIKKIDFSRKYSNKCELRKSLEEPTAEMMDIIYQQMGKFNEKDIKNCGACGYMSCKKMTKAILNNLYKPQQCHHFLESFYNDKSNETI